MYRFAEALTIGDTTILDRFVSDDFIEHSPDSPSGREVLKNIYQNGSCRF